MDRRIENRGQIYTLEALVAVLIIGTFALFVAPSLAVSISEEDIEDTQNDEEINQEINGIIEEYQSKGHIHSLLLSWDNRSGLGVEGWSDTEGPRIGDTQHYLSLQTEDDDNIDDWNPLFQQLRQFEDENGVRTTITLSPVEGDNQDDEIMFLDGGGEGDAIGSKTTKITLYNSDIVRLSEQSKEGYAEYPTQSIYPNTDNSYPLDEVDEEGDYIVFDQHEDSNVYVTFEVNIVIYGDTE